MAGTAKNVGKTQKLPIERKEESFVAFVRISHASLMRCESVFQMVEMPLDTAVFINISMHIDLSELCAVYSSNVGHLSVRRNPCVCGMSHLSSNIFFLFRSFWMGGKSCGTDKTKSHKTECVWRPFSTLPAILLALACKTVEKKKINTSNLFQNRSLSLVSCIFVMHILKNVDRLLRMPTRGMNLGTNYFIRPSPCAAILWEMGSHTVPR